MMPAAESLARELLAQVQHLRDLYGDPTVVPFGRCRAREKMFATADKLEAALKAPLTIQPWNDGGHVA